MSKYYVNKNAQPVSGDHEVHVTGCASMPESYNYIDLGEQATSTTAVQKAKTYYSDSNGCAHCCPACHTT
jgi:hypothetical protein